MEIFVGRFRVYRIHFATSIFECPQLVEIESKYGDMTLLDP